MIQYGDSITNSTYLHFSGSGHVYKWRHVLERRYINFKRYALFCIIKTGTCIRKEKGIVKLLWVVDYGPVYHT